MILFSDIHGHVEALRQLLDSTAGPYVCAGDVLGSGGGNAECLELLRDIPTVKGNHEVDLLHVYKIQIPDWPLELSVEGACVTHTLIEPTSSGPHFQRVHHDYQVLDLLAHSGHRLVFIGHTHLPGWWQVRRGGEVHYTPVYEPLELPLEADNDYVINIGSLGEPGRPTHPRYVEWTPGRVRWSAL